MPIPAGVQAKLDRADPHIAELGTALQPLLPQCVTAIRTETYNGVEYEELYVSKLPVLGADLGCIVGDALHNLRSALDHMAEALVLASGETPTRHTAFPVRKPGKTTPKIDGGGSIPPKALTIIERVQPDHDPAHASPLAQLVALNNIDKHRSVLLAAFRARHASWSWAGRHGEPSDFGPFEEGSVILRARRTDSQPLPAWQPTLELAIGLNHPTELGNNAMQHAPHLLRTLAHHVQWIVGQLQPYV